MESRARLNRPTDNSNLATRRGFLATAAFASASALSLTAYGTTKVDSTWSIAGKLVQDGAIGDVRYISVMVPVANVMDAYAASLRILAPARQAKSVESRHSVTGAFSMRCEVEGGAQIAIASVSDGTAQRVTVQGSEGSIHIVDGLVSVQSRGEWREIVS